MTYYSDGTGDTNFPLQEGTGKPTNINRKEYEQNLKRRQQEHLDSINNNMFWRPCLHDSCSECIGTGLKKDGSICIHNLSCPCPKCTPHC